jgi:integrase
MRGSLHKVHTKRPLKKGEFTWQIILSLGRGAEGKYKQKWIRFHGTRQQAQAKLTELTTEVNRGEFIEPSRITLGEWLDEWLDKAIRPPRCTQSTHIIYKSIIRKHIKPALGTHVLQRLTPLHIERYYADSKLSARTVAVHHAILTSALTAGVNAGLLRSNVAKRATNKPRIRTSEDVLHNVWTAEEARRFLTTVKEHAKPQYAALFALALDSGARKAELLGLRWSDIDGCTMRIERQFLRCARSDDGSRAPVFSLPKGKRARQLDLSQQTLELLKAHKRDQAELKLKHRLNYTDHGLIFAQTWERQTGNDRFALGWPLQMMNVNKHLDRLCAAAGVKRITAHGLRHTCATLLLSAGVPAHVVQRRLGHKDITITLGLYAHVLPSQQQDAAARLAGLLHG